MRPRFARRDKAAALRHTEYRISAEALAEINTNIVGAIEVIASFGPSVA